jgi:predicted permease
MHHDLRFAIRTLAKTPGVTAVAIAALALGIGANTTVFSLANAVMFKTLPFAHSERILYIAGSDLKTGRDTGGVSYPDYRDFRAQVKSFDGLGAFARCEGNLSDSLSLPENYRCFELTSNAFSVIGQKPVMGRDFLPEDERPGATPVAILTYGLWEARYGKDPAVVGRTIRVNTVPTAVIGVMARGIQFPTESQLWLPLVASAGQKREDRHLTVFGRMADSADFGSARAELDTIARRLASQYPETNKDTGTLVQRFNEMAVNNRVRTVFLVLLGAVGFVLLIACANVANLLLARAIGRSREISIRTALGASRWQVVRQLLVESVLLSLAGGAMGWLLANWGIHAFDAAVIPTGKPQWIDFSMDYRVFGYLAAISIGTGILFGLAPALRVSKLDVSTALREGGRGAGAARRGRFLSGLLVVAEMALAVVLLAGAGLMIRSFLYAYSTPTGVNTANLLTMRVDLPAVRYAIPSQQIAFEQLLVKQLVRLPGVDTAVAASHLPGEGAMQFAYELEGAPPADSRHRPDTPALIVGADYFRAMQVQPRRGRAFTESDGAAGVPVAIVNQSFASRHWPAEQPLGKRLRLVKANLPQAWLTVVGVVPDILQNNSNWVQRDPILYLPYRQEPQRHLVILARTLVPAASLGDTFRRTVQAVDQDLPVRDVITLEDQLALMHWPVRVFGSMFAIFALMALALASVGLYAVIAHAVSQRTHEIGVRVALGASAGGILRLVLAQGMRQMAIGLAAGLAAALGITRVLSALLVGVSPTDPVTFVTVALVLIASALLGCAIPARRAMLVDPVVALRDE